MQSPRIAEEKVGQYYKNTLYWGGDLRNYQPTDWHNMRINHYGPIYKLIDARFKTPRSILDVGCGLGLLLSYYKEKGWQTLGTEYMQDVATFAKKNFGVDVLIGQLEKLKLDRQFDVVVFSGVFEHLYHPDKILKKVFKILKKDGLLIIVLPNIDSLGHVIFRRHWHTLDPGRHVFHYSPKTITKLLSKYGFKIEGIKHNHWMHNSYGLFTSLRFLFSPKFSTKPVKSTPVTSKMRFRKIAGRMLANTGAMLESFLHRGESMIVYAHHLS